MVRQFRDHSFIWNKKIRDNIRKRDVILRYYADENGNMQ